MIETLNGFNFPQKRIKKITYRENGKVESVEYFDDQVKHCSRPCCSQGQWWQQPVISDSTTTTTTFSTYWGNL